MTFADKLRQARQLRKLSQEELGNLTGVSRRSVISWEMGEATPRSRTMRTLADALQVSYDYLKHDGITDPLHGSEKKAYIDEARERYGEKAAQELDFLLERQRVFFAAARSARKPRTPSLKRSCCGMQEEARRASL